MNRLKNVTTPVRARNFILPSLTVLAVCIVFTILAACSASTEQPAASQSTSASSSDWKAVDEAMGRTGAMQPGDVYKFSLPRGDMHVTVNGVELKPALALGGWVAFKKMGNEAMVMGDLVLAEDEVTPVMTKLQQNGIEQAALHNHVLRESPRVMYMHIGGHGDPVKLAKAIHDALALTKTPAPSPAGAPPSQDIGIDTKQI